MRLGALMQDERNEVYPYLSTEFEYIQGSEEAVRRGVHRSALNEKTAMEAALGMSYAGKRAMVAMKHVGLNVAADSFINSAMTGVNGGLVVVAADDPSMHSSQNEQDSRFYGRFSFVPVMNRQISRKHDMVFDAFEISEIQDTGPFPHYNAWPIQGQSSDAAIPYLRKR
jgi:indolepyruvate ferredoxin oxidoreductase alpha subunit